MSRLAILLVGSAVICQSGCQNFGGGGYPMQSVTRVPPPGTGSYPVGGGYYGAPASAQSSNVPSTPSASNFVDNSVGATIGALGNQANLDPNGASSYVTQAQFTASDASFSPVPSGMFDEASSAANHSNPPQDFSTQPGFFQGNSTSQQPIENAPIPALQWQ